VWKVVQGDAKDSKTCLANIYQQFKANVDPKDIPELHNKYDRSLNGKLVRYRGLVSDRIADEIYDLAYHPDVENADPTRDVHSGVPIMRDIYAVRPVPYTHITYKQQLDPTEHLVIKVCRGEETPVDGVEPDDPEELKIAKVYDFYGIFDADDQSIGAIHQVLVTSLVDGAADETSRASIDTESAYKKLHDVLTQIFYSDKVSAEYCLLGLLSTVYARADPLPLGRLSLNFGNVPDQDFALNLVEFLRKVCPCVAYIPMDLQNSMIMRSFSRRKRIITKNLKKMITSRRENSKLHQALYLSSMKLKWLAESSRCKV